MTDADYIKDYLKDEIGKIVVVNDIHELWQQQRERFLYTGQPAKLREVLKDELVVEFDHKEISGIKPAIGSADFIAARAEAEKYVRAVADKFSQRGICYHISDHHGRSPHLRTKIIGLGEYPKEVRAEYKRGFMKALLATVGYTATLVEIDDSLLTAYPKLVSFELQPHFKPEWAGMTEEITLIAPGSFLEVQNETVREISKKVWEEIKPISNTSPKVKAEIQAIKSKIKVSDILAEYQISLKKNPTDCPFHSSAGGKCLSYDDKEKGGVWHCFHCGKEGDIFTLWGYLHNEQSFFDTLRELAAKAGINNESDKPTIILPIQNRLISDFAAELVEHLKDRHEMFYRFREFKVQKLELLPQADIKKRDVTILGFKDISAADFITYAEKYVQPGVMVKVKDSKESSFCPKSMHQELAKIILEAGLFKEALPLIDEIFDCPIPIIYEDKLTFPERGYDKRFESWLPYDAPTIIPDMPLDKALELIDFIYAEFCFAEPNDKIKAIAALLTPFLRGLYPRRTCRSPIFFYKANRERAGKDYCAEIPGVVFSGIAQSDPPISDGKETHDEEFRKKLMATFRTGKRRLHMSNNKGCINSAELEFISTSENFTDRVLGSNTTLSFPNTLEFSLSANTGITYTPDLAMRCVFINLMLAMENPNERQFHTPDLHGWIKEHRGDILSALYALVRNWVEKGMPAGTTRFASFPEWARICGGVMVAAGIGDPCENVIDKGEIGGDEEVRDMRVLFELCYERFKSTYIFKKDIINLLVSNDPADEAFHELFAYLDWKNEKATRTKIGMIIEKYVGRILSGILLKLLKKDTHSERQQYRFLPAEGQNMGTLGTLGTFFHSVKLQENNCLVNRSMERSPFSPKVPINDPENLEEEVLDQKDNILRYISRSGSEGVHFDKIRQDLGLGVDELDAEIKVLLARGDIAEHRPNIYWKGS